MLRHINKVITVLFGYICIMIGIGSLVWKITIDSTDAGILFIVVGLLLIKSCWKWFIKKI